MKAVKSEFKSQSLCPQSPCFFEFIKHKTTITLLKQELPQEAKYLELTRIFTYKVHKKSVTQRNHVSANISRTQIIM